MLEGLEDVMKDVKRSTKVDASTAVEEYINKEDWRISANANTGYSHAGLVNNLAGKMIANFWLDNVYTKKEGDAHRNGDYHIHDLDILAPYCFTADTCIKTMEYGDISIAELLDKNLESFTVFTTDLADVEEYKLELEEDIDKEEYKTFIYKHFFTKKAKNLRKTRENAELLKLEFEDGYSVRCTPDHKFLGSFRATNPLTYDLVVCYKWGPAEKLESGDEIVSYNGITKKIKSVAKLDEKEDVYCMEVEDTHCFALANGVIAHNCCGHDLQKLLREGFNGVISRVGSKPPKHVREALYQMANFIGILQAEWAGAQAFSSFDTFLGPLVFFDMQFGGVTEDDIKKAVRNFVYNLNVPSRWGQSPFSNITIDINCPRDLGNQMPMRGDTGFFLSIKEEYKEYFDIIEKFKKENRSTDELLNDKDALRALEKCTAWNSMIKELRNRVEGSKDMDEDTLLYSVTYKLFEPEMHIITKAYYEVMNEGDAYGLPFTFPIPTVNITEDFDWDSEISDLVFENAAKYGSSYFQNFIGSQYRRNPETGEMERNPDAYSPNDVRSMCPLTFDTQVVAKTKWETTLRKIGEMYHTQNDKGANYKVFNNGKWYDCDIICVGKQNTYTISTSNNMSIELGEHHLQPILRDNKEITVEAKDINVGDMIPWNIHPIDGILNSGYDIGYVVGAYLGDGSVDDCGGINYSLSADDKDIETANTIRNFFESLGFRVKEKINGNLRTVRVGAGSYDIIKKYFTGDNALTKKIASNIITYSIDTRQGILDGLIATDGLRKSSRISTSSKDLVDSINTLAMSVGLKSYCSFEDTRDNRLGTNTNYLVSLILEKLNYKDKFKTVNGKAYYYVTNIKNNNNEKTLYCVEIEDNNSDRLFVLGNGMITHNCRLQLDKTQIRKKLEKRGGGLFGSDAQTGSVGVVTINMARLGYNFKGNIKGLYKQLFKLMDMAKSTLEKKRKFVVSMNERGLYPYTHRYVRTLDTYFSTIGVNGINEMIRNFTNDEYDITDPRGEKMANEVLDAIRERLIKYQEETGNMYNLEATPAEGTTYRLAKEDAKRYSKRTVSYIMCPVHGKVEVNATEEEVVCPLCEKEASKN